MQPAGRPPADSWAPTIGENVVAEQDADGEAAKAASGQLAVMLEGRLGLPARVRQRDPQLHAVEGGIVLSR
jgi:hypothetical protein